MTFWCQSQTNTQGKLCVSWQLLKWVASCQHPRCFHESWTFVVAQWQCTLGHVMGPLSQLLCSPAARIFLWKLRVVSVCSQADIKLMLTVSLTVCYLLHPKVKQWSVLRVHHILPEHNKWLPSQSEAPVSRLQISPGERQNFSSIPDLSVVCVPFTTILNPLPKGSTAPIHCAGNLDGSAVLME